MCPLHFFSYIFYHLFSHFHVYAFIFTSAYITLYHTHLTYSLMHSSVSRAVSFIPPIWDFSLHLAFLLCLAQSDHLPRTICHRGHSRGACFCVRIICNTGCLSISPLAALYFISVSRAAAWRPLASGSFLTLSSPSDSLISCFLHILPAIFVLIPFVDIASHAMRDVSVFKKAMIICLF